MLRSIMIMAAAVMLCCGLKMQQVQAAGAGAQNKAVYTIRKIRDTYKKSGAQVDAKYSYQLPQLKGNSSAVKKINAELKKDYQSSLKAKKSVFDYAKESADSFYKETYYDQTSCRAVYNKNGYISFYYSNSNFAGGPHGYMSQYAKTFSLKTGKKLIVSDVVAGSKKAVKDKIIQKCLSQMRASGYFNDDTWSDPEQAAKDFLNKTPISRFNFYIKNGRAAVFFNQYDLGMSYAAGIAPKVVLKGNYE